MKTHSEKFLQQRRFCMALPALVLPFITMIFWALGGGQGTPAQAMEIKSGLNLEVPSAYFNKEEEVWDKFSLYEQAKRDSIKYAEAKRNDPYYVVNAIKVKSDTSIRKSNRFNTSLGNKNKYAEMEKDEALINERLDLLTKTINETDNEKLSSPSVPRQQNEVSPNLEMTSDVDRLEQMMQAMSEGSTNDPEMKQMGEVLDKILDIQHPERTQEKIREKSLEHKQQAFPVQVAPEEEYNSLLEQKKSFIPKDTSIVSFTSIQKIQNAFYGLEESGPVEEVENSIEAVIHDTQTVVAGSVIKMRLLSDVYINGQLLEKDQFVFGTCAIAGERLTISINSIRDEHSLLPVALSVYDMDGMEGVFIPGAITRDAAKQAGSQSVQDVQLYSMNNSLQMQAATAGIEAAKGLFSKKAKLIKVTVKAGYQILLKDTNQKNS